MPRTLEELGLKVKELEERLDVVEALAMYNANGKPEEVKPEIATEGVGDVEE